ncbi:energy transducer TonB [Dechloromonas hortensis]|uniref:energy transducer TonB n=1 Tax=Dechloromonas hortensis TaxID=337779 RepID=UPI001291D33D|nr:energy transducer TonB [Dechloromonas hortensis]
MLLRSLIVSLLLHLLFFFGLRGMALPLAPLSAAAPKALEAVLSKAAVPEAPAHSVQERPVPKVVTDRRERIIGPARENSRSEAPVLAANVPSTAAVHSVSSAKDGGGPAPTAQTIAAVPTDVIDADGLRQYRLALAKEARRYKRYPALARERNWEGVVTVTISIPLPGALPLVSLGKSSGHEILDRQALEMIGQAVLAASLPESLRGKAVSVSLPVRYSLDE